MEMDPGVAIRAFLALPLAPSFHSEVNPFLTSLNSKFPRVRWIRPSELHLTLHFFGSIPKADVKRIGEAVKPCCKRTQPFEMSLENFGAFPDLKRPRVIWLGMGGEADRLRELYKKIETSLNREGFVGAGRTFKPHVTIGRVKGKSGILGLEKIRFEPTPSRSMEEIILFRSHLTPQGATYERIATYPFAAA